MHSAVPRIGVIAADGVFGGATQAQILNLQGLFGLSRDGVVGSQTWSVLSSVAAAVRQGCLTGVARASQTAREADQEAVSLAAPAEEDALSVASSPYPGRPLSAGSYGKDVSRLKTALFEKGECGCRALSERALYGSATRHTVMDYQRKIGLPVTGIVDEETWNAVFS
ncbi:MAG: peptidoglycan-binding protein [Clostridia bacterium]|nr:peptidoglycan-binding protein [Clostridia bacterium]